MVTLILPGYSAKNKEWSEKVSENLRIGGTIRPVFWDHWTDPTQKFKVKEKARLLGDISDKLIINIVAKSIGTLVASHIIQKYPSQIGKVIFCGIPLNDFDEKDKEEMKTAINLLPSKNIICYQNAGDPHGTFEQVKGYVDKLETKVKIIENDRDDHAYPFYEEFNIFLS
jgi:pimeloyl-ACP methyl ester carboxylesterase